MFCLPQDVEVIYRRKYLITINDFIKEYKLKNEATSNTKIRHILSSLSLNDVWIYLRDGLFASDIGIVNFDPSKETHWVLFINEIYFPSYGIVCPKKLAKIIIKRNKYCVYSEYQRQKMIVFVRAIVYT